MFYFQTNALGFTPEFLGRVRLAGSLASLAGKAFIRILASLIPLCTLDVLALDLLRTGALTADTP